MICLALDTALDACSVAVVEGEHVLALRSEAMVRGHQERLAPMVSEAMAEAGVDFAGLDRILVTVGPGSFTGLRVGLAFARAMALALDIPCVGVGTLEVLAGGAAETTDAPLAAAALDGRRGRVYLQAFRGCAPVSPAANLSVAEAEAWLRDLGAGDTTPIAGSGAALLAIGASVRPNAGVDVLALARLGIAAPSPDAPPQPLYLRAPDARTLAERAAATS